MSHLDGVTDLNTTLVTPVIDLKKTSVTSNFNIVFAMAQNPSIPILSRVHSLGRIS